MNTETGFIRNYIADLVKKRARGGVTSTSSPTVSSGDGGTTPTPEPKPTWEETFNIASYTDPAAELRQRAQQAYNILPKDEQGSVPLLSSKTRIGDKLFFNPDSGEIVSENSATNLPMYWKQSGEGIAGSGTNRYLTIEETEAPAYFDPDSAQLLYSFYKILANPQNETEAAVAQEFSQVTPASLIESQFETKKAAIDQTFSFATDLEKIYASQSADEINSALSKYGERITFGNRNLGYVVSEGAYVPEELIGAAMANEQGVGSELANILATATHGGGLLLNLLGTIGKFSRPVESDVAQPLSPMTVSMGGSDVTSSAPMQSLGNEQTPLTKEEQEQRQTQIQALQDEAARRINNMFQFAKSAANTDLDKKTTSQSNIINALFSPEKELEKNYAVYEQAAQLHNEAYASVQLNTVDGFRNAISALTQAYKLESDIGARNVYAAYDWMNDPAKEQRFFETMAQVELQKGEPLTRLEVLQLKEKFADPAVEFTGQFAYDFLNLLDLPVGKWLSKLPEGKVLNALQATIPRLDELDAAGVLWNATKSGVSGGASALALLGRSELGSVLPQISKLDGVVKFSQRQVAKNLYDDVHYLISRSFGAQGFGSGSVDDIAKVMGNLGDDVASLKSAGKNTDEIVQELSKSGKYTGEILTQRKIQTVEQMLDLLDPTVEGANSWSAIVDASNSRVIDALAENKAAQELQSLSFKGDLSADEVKQLVTQTTEDAKKWALKNVRPDHVAHDISNTFKQLYLEKNTVEGTKYLKDQFKALASKLIGSKTVDWFGDLYSKWFGNWITQILSRAPKFFGVFQPVENTMLYHFTRNGSLFGSLDQLFRNYPDLIDNILDLPVAGRRGFTGSLGFDVGDAEDIVAMLKQSNTAWLPTPKAFKFWADASIQKQQADWLKYVDDYVAEIASKEEGRKIIGIVNIGKGKFKGSKVLTFMGKPIRIIPKKVQFAWNAWADAGKSISAANELVVKATIAQERYLNDLYKVNPIALSESIENFTAALKAKGVSDDVVKALADNARNVWNASGGSTFRMKNLLSLADMTGGKVAAQAFVPDEFFTKKLAMSVQEQDAFLRDVAQEWTNYTATLDDLPTEQNVSEFFDTMRSTYKSDYESLLDPQGMVGKGMLGDMVPEQIVPNNLDVSKDIINNQGVVFDNDIAQQMQGNKFWDLPSEERTKAIEQLRDSRPDLVELNNAFDTYGLSRATLEDKKIRLDEIRKAEPANEIANKAYAQIDNTIQTLDHMDSRMSGAGGFLYFGFPGAKNMPTNMAHEYYKLVNDIKTNYLVRKASYLDEVTKAMEKGTEIPVATVRDWLSWNGWDVTTDSGRIVEATFSNPSTGLRQSFGRVLDGNGAIVDSPTLHKLKDWFGIYDESVLNAPLSLSRGEMLDLKKASKGADTVTKILSPEQYQAEKKLFFDVELQHSLTGDDQPIRDLITPVLGDSIDDMEPEEIIKQLRTKAKSVDVEEVSATLSDVADELEYRLKYFENNYVTGDKALAAPVQPLDTVPENVRAWTRVRLKNSAQYTGVVNTLDEWEQILKNKVKDGSLALPEIDATTSPIVKAEYNNLLTRMAQMEDNLWLGGQESGFKLEGAIPFMKTRMRVGTENVVDQYMKGIVPFWNFATRGTAAWANAAMEHPEIIQWYFRNIRMSRGQAYEYGATDSKGQQLASTKGKIYIPALQIWVDPFAVSPFFKYYLTPNNASDNDEYEDLPPLEEFYYRMRSEAAMRGFGISPVVDIALTAMGAKDLYTDQTAAQKMVYYGVSSVVPTDLVPPFVWNSINSAMRKIQFTGQPDLWNTKVKWFDYLVEDRMAKSYLQKIQASASEADKMALVDEMTEALKQREKSDIWNSYYDQVSNTDYFKSMAGYFTGIYAKPFTIGDSELYRLRDSINITKDAINSEVRSQIFFPYMDAEQIYSTYTDERYDTPEGRLYGVRSAFSWVTDDETGQQLYGLDRRKQISAILDRNIATQGKYEELSIAYQTYQDKMRTIPIGRTYSDPRASQYYKDLAEEKLRIEMKYPNADNTWSIGYKPESMIYTHYRNLWWETLYLTYPQRDYEGGESYGEWDSRRQEWMVNLGKLAQTIAPVFNVSMTTSMPKAYGGQNTDDILKQLIKETTTDGFRQWDLDNDSVETALLRVWDETYANKYWETMSGLSGNTRILAESNFLKANPKPTPEQLLLGVKDLYGNRWTDDEILDAMRTPEDENRDILDIRQAGEVGKSDEQTKYEELWTIYSWTRPNSKDLQLLQKTITNSDSTFDSRNWDIFFNSTSPASWKDPSEFEKFYQGVKNAVAQIGLQSPTGVDLNTKVQAEQLNNMLKATLQIQLGNNYSTYVDAYNSLYGNFTQQKEWRDAHPNEYEIVRQYSKLRDAFGKKYPLWAQYYQAEGSSPSLGTSAPAASNLELPSGFVSNTNVSPAWLQRVSDIKAGKLAPTVLDITYAKNLLATNPEYGDFLNEILSILQK